MSVRVQASGLRRGWFRLLESGGQGWGGGLGSRVDLGGGGLRGLLVGVKALLGSSYRPAERWAVGGLSVGRARCMAWPGRR